MRIIGVDPGTRVAGYGVVDLVDGRLRAVAAGVWRLDPRSQMPDRLAQLSLEFSRVVDTFSPNILCLEMAFVAMNVRSAMSLGLARGVILSQGALRGMAVHEMTASAAKKAVLDGRAGKDAVARILETLLGVRFDNIPLDASDALAIAYAHGLREKERALFENGQRQRQGVGCPLSKERACSSSLFGRKSKPGKGKKQGFEIWLKAGTRGE